MFALSDLQSWSWSSPFVLSLGIILEVFRMTLEDIIRKCRDSMKAPRLQVNRDSRMIGLLTCGVASFASLA